MVKTEHQTPVRKPYDNSKISLGCRPSKAKCRTHMLNKKMTTTKTSINQSQATLLSNLHHKACLGTHQAQACALDLLQMRAHNHWPAWLVHLLHVSPWDCRTHLSVFRLHNLLLACHRQTREAATPTSHLLQNRLLRLSGQVHNRLLSLSHVKEHPQVLDGKRTLDILLQLCLVHLLEVARLQVIHTPTGATRDHHFLL
jgi:hypothetical protein